MLQTVVVVTVGTVLAVFVIAILGAVVRVANEDTSLPDEDDE